MRLKIENKYFKWGLTAFLSISACIVLFFMFYRSEGLLRDLGILLDILSPFIYGFVLAYLLSPVFNASVRTVQAVLSPFTYNRRALIRLAKFLSTIFSMVVTFAVVSGLIIMVMPQLISSIMGILNTFPSNADGLMIWLVDNFKLSEETIKFINNNVIDTMTDWVMENLVPSMSEVVEGVSLGVFSALIVMKNFLIGVIICIYFLNSKEIFAAQAKKFFYANFKQDKAEFFINETRFINKTFSGFINGKIIDSIIIGILCFISLTIMDMPYTLLISVIVGITNIIPFFGPFIGAIPSTIIVLLESPIQAVYFVIFILILQQIDGNIIGPKILGESTGIPSFWVIFAILVGGGLFGFVGMIVGIPIFAILYAYIGRYTRFKLKKKGLPTATSDYKDMSIYKHRLK